MFTNWKSCLLAAAVTCIGSQISQPGTNAHATPASPTSEQLEGNVAYATYTVWYRPGAGFRWTGYGGLTYYDASMLVREYWKKGWYAYMEIEG